MTDTEQQPIQPQESTPIQPPVENPAPIQPEQVTEQTSQPQAPAQPESAPIASPPPPQPTQPSSKSFLAKALESIQFRKKAKLEKIMKLANEKKSITNDQVQKLLRISDATTTRYLSELVKQNKLKRIGTTTNIRYEPTLGSIPTE